MIRVALLPAILLLFTLGCGKSEPTPGGSAPNPGQGGPPSSGNAVFDKNCSNCHALDAGSGGPKRKGPNLAKVGAAHDAAWLADHVKDPKTHKPASMMPEFGSKLSAEEIKSVSDFMAGLK